MLCTASPPLASTLPSTRRVACSWAPVDAFMSAVFVQVLGGVKSAAPGSCAKRPPTVRAACMFVEECTTQSKVSVQPCFKYIMMGDKCQATLLELLPCIWLASQCDTVAATQERAGLGAKHATLHSCSCGWVTGGANAEAGGSTTIWWYTKFSGLATDTFCQPASSFVRSKISDVL